MLGTTPIVWCGAYFATLYLKASAREPISLDAPTRIVGFWAESAGDFEARCRYSRWTPGRHVVLLDNELEPQRERVCGRDGRTHRADGSQSQRAAADRPGARGPRAVARQNWLRAGELGNMRHAGQLAELTSLDRHEVANVVIAAMGSVDQEPPKLLAEGWAESQSKDRADLIMDLAWRKAENSTYSLDELMEPEWYGRSDGPAYNHGGPFVVFLMEHYGPKKFLSCITEFARPRPSRLRRILGDSWAKVEEKFWAWLAIEVTAQNISVAEDAISDAADKVGARRVSRSRRLAGHRRRLPRRLEPAAGSARPGRVRSRAHFDWEPRQLGNGRQD